MRGERIVDAGQAGFHFVIVEAAEYGVWSILNNLEAFA
jgi:hypothetical protein